MQDKIIIPNEFPVSEVAPIVGGKGSNLLRLVTEGVDVPHFIILPSRCFNDFIKSFQAEFDKYVQQLDCSTPAKVAETARALRECMCSRKIPAEISGILFSKLKKIVQEDSFFAVRSSALGEDSKEFSYAGMLDTYLFCRTDEEISQAIVKCWSSIYSDRAVSYRHFRGIAQFGLSMAVVVQQMIDGKVSGVTFSVNPTTKYEDEILINAVWGLGEGLVSGAIDSDQFVCLKKAPYPIDSRIIARKTEQIVFDRKKGYGTMEETLDDRTATKPCLTDTEISLIAEVSHRIEKAYKNVPQDIEWTIGKDGKLKILQARPITTIERPWPSERAYSTIWDNSNIVESYSGTTTPLTFSFALNAYHNVYVQFCQVLKVPEEKIQKHDFAFANMLGLLNGRVYYNLKNWYRLVSVLPGYSYNSRFMEGMMGVKAKFEMEVDDSAKSGFFQKYFIELPKLAYVGLNLAYQFYTIDDQVKKFMNIYTTMYNKYKDFNFYSAPAHRNVEIYTELTSTVLKNWKAPIINDFMAMIFYGILKSLINNWKLDTDGSLQNDLVAGQGNVESTMPMRALQKIARKIAANQTLSEVFKKNEAPVLKEMFLGSPKADEIPEISEIRKCVKEYLEEFGYRTMNELKLEEPSLNERPDFIFAMLKNYSAGKLPPEEDTGRKEALIREQAEEKCRVALNGQKMFGLIPKYDVLKFVANYAKKAVAVREFQRFARTKMYGIARRVFLGIGHRFAERGLLDDPNDVFYLTQDEVISYVVGSATSQRLKELAGIRKAEFAEYTKSEDLPDRIETKGIVYTNDLRRSLLQVVQSDDPNTLKGLGGCSGVIRGKVKVILSPRDDMSLNGEILVAARTDPGWVPLFASATGLLIERGSMLSHSVIVARELGLPAIVGITDVTKRLKTGDEVEMDGTTGIVKILSRANS